nr:hypothetical protein [Kitasatospora sp. RG8]
MPAWSFVRDDQPLADTARHVALALRDEVADLEATGAAVVQVHEPTLRASTTSMRPVCQAPPRRSRCCGRALRHLPAERLRVSPDRGLKTRAWAEVRPRLEHLVAAARRSARRSRKRRRGRSQCERPLRGGAPGPGRTDSSY